MLAEIATAARFVFTAFRSARKPPRNDTQKTMFDALAIICFGWPAIITSILLSLAGLLLKKPTLLVIAGVVGIPFTFYLSGGFRNAALLLPLFQFGSAFAIRRQKTRLAWLLLAPLMIVAVILALVVLTQ